MAVAARFAEVVRSSDSPASTWMGWSGHEVQCDDCRATWDANYHFYKVDNIQNGAREQQEEIKDLIL